MMDRETAMEILRTYYNNGMLVSEEPMYIEALEYLCLVEKDDNAMMELGGYYYDSKRFDLALKWYELAYETSGGNNSASSSCLGYIWYYGRTGTIDYEKAYKYFYRSSMMGNVTAKIKLADMHKNGYYVEKDYDKYCEIIEELYGYYQQDRVSWHVVPDICNRLGAIRLKQGQLDEAADLYLIAKEHLIDRIRDSAFFGDISIMKWIESDLYKCQVFDEDSVDIYDAYYLIDKAKALSFTLEKDKYCIEFVKEDSIVIKFGDKWYRTIDDFFNNARIDGILVTALYYHLDNYEVVYDDN